MPSGNTQRKTSLFHITMLIFVAAVSVGQTRVVQGADDESVEAVVKWLKANGASLYIDDSGAVRTVDLGINVEFGDKSKWTDADLARLKPLKTLRWLRLSDPGFTPAGLAKLAGQEGLEDLEISTKISAEHLAAIGKIKQLKKLDIFNGPVTTLEPLAGLTNLEELLVPGEQLGDKGFKHVAKLVALKTIEIRDGKFTDLSPLAELGKLETVYMYGSAINDAGLAPLAKSKSVMELRIGNSKITDVGLAAIAGMTQLRDLDLSLAKITDLSPLAGMTEMVALKLNSVGMEIDNADMKHLAGMKKMKWFEIYGANVSDISVLRNMPKLVGVELGKTKIDDDDLENLMHMNKDQGGELSIIDGTKVTKKGVEKLQKAYPKKLVL